MEVLWNSPVTAAVHVSCCKALGFFIVYFSCVFSLLLHFLCCNTVFLYNTSPLVKCCNSLNYNYKYRRNAFYKCTGLLWHRSLMHTSLFWWSPLNMMWWQITSSGDLIRYEHLIQKYQMWGVHSKNKNLNQQGKAENRIEKNTER